MGSKIYEDIKSLDGKIFKLQFSIINEITKKSITNQYSKEEINEFLRDAKLEDRFEKIIYVNLVNVIKSYDLVLKILLSGDDQMISDVLRKCTFFFSDTKFTPEFYIEKIYPKISYTNRNKLLQTLTENSTKSRNEEFYKILNKLYNREAALKFLPYCGDEFILEKLQSEIIIDARNLSKLYNTNPEFVVMYLQEFTKIAKAEEPRSDKYNLTDYKELIHKIMSHHVNEFVGLVEDMKPQCSFLQSCGKRLTKRIVKNKKSVIISDPNHYTYILKSSQIHRYLKPDEFDKFYLGLMPKKKVDFEGSFDNGVLNTHLNYYKSTEKQKTLLLNSYSKIFNKNLLDDLTNITPKVMKMLSAEERIKYVNEKIQKDGDKYLTPIEWVKFLPTDQSIKKYRDEIYITSDQKKRYELIDLMVETCGINNDYDAGLKVLQYFNQRHRNEGKLARDHLLAAIENSLDLDKFNESHWKEMYEIFDILSLNDEFRYYTYSSKQTFLKCVEYALKNDLDLTKPLTYFIKWVNHSYESNKFEIFKNNSAWSKLCLLKICDLIPTIYAGDELDKSKIMDLYSSICEWNKKNPNEELSITDYEWAVKCMDSLVDDNDYQAKDILRNLQYDKKAKILYQTKLTTEENFDIYRLKDFLIYNKELVKLGMKKIAENCLEPYYALSYIEPYIRKLLNIDGMEEYIKTHCNKILGEKENSSRPNALRFLVKRNWITNKEFYDLAREYYPKGKKQELGNSKAENFARFQTSIIYCLKKFKNDPESLKTIKLFCQGDYLKISIGTLYHLCTKLPYDKVFDFLSTCIDTPVSFKKHVIRLKCIISNRQECIDFLRELWKIESNPSIRQILLQLIIDIFFGENSQHSEFLWECLQSLTIKDKLIVEDLFKRVSTIPKDMRGQYLEHCWPLICKIRLQDSEFKQLKSQFLSAFNDNIDLMATDFVENLLKENVFKLKIEFAHLFARDVGVSYIVKGHSKEEQSRRFNFILELMKQAIDSDWNTLSSIDEKLDGYSGFEYPLRDFVQQFCSEFCRKTIEENGSQYLATLLLELNAKLHLLLKDPEVFIYNSYWNIQFTLLYINCNKNYSEFGKQFKELIQKSLKKNRFTLLTNFLNVLSTFTSSYFDQNEKQKANETDFVIGLLSDPINEENALVAINLLGLPELKKMQHKKTLAKLFSLNNPVINTELNYFN